MSDRSSVAPSPIVWPEPRQRAAACLRKPGVKKASPRRLRGGVRAAQVLDTWMRRRRVSNVEFGEALEVSERLVRELRDRNKPLYVGDLFALAEAGARNLALQLLDEIRLGVMQHEPSNDHG